MTASSFLKYFLYDHSDAGPNVSSSIMSVRACRFGDLLRPPTSLIVASLCRAGSRDGI